MDPYIELPSTKNRRINILNKGICIGDEMLHLIKIKFVV